MLLVLLMMATISSFALFTGRVALSQISAFATQDDAEIALRMARMGIDEGYQRLMSGYGLESDDRTIGKAGGEFGTIVSNNYTYEVQPKYRATSKPAYANGCTEVGPMLPSKPASRDCPYYSLAIHRYGHSFGQLYTASILPQQKMIMLRFAGAEKQKPREGYLIFNMQDPIAGSDSAESLPVRLTSGYLLRNGNQVPNSDFIYDVAANNDTVQYRFSVGLNETFDAIAFSYANESENLVSQIRVSALSQTNKVVLDKGYVTVEAVGYSGDVERRLVLTVPEKFNGPDINWLVSGSGAFQFSESKYGAQSSLTDKSGCVMDGTGGSSNCTNDLTPASAYHYYGEPAIIGEPASSVPIE